MAPPSYRFDIDSKLDRRRFLRLSAVIASGALLAPVAFRVLTAQAAPAFAKRSGYGGLVEAADLRDGVKRLALPEGFSYRSFGVAGDLMSDGNLTPIAHDGMAAFTYQGDIRLVRNHEDRNGPGSGTITPLSYDFKAGGGNTTLVVDPQTRELKRDFVSITGTIVNCGGGPTPWGSWLTCEETTAGPSDGWDQNHGYVYEVPASANSPIDAVPYKDMGRFAHEAVAVEPGGSIVYQTEDSGSNSGFYRFIANTPRRLTNGGNLQMLAVDGSPNYDTSSGQQVGQPLWTHWVDIDDPDPADDAGDGVANQGHAKGGALFSRLEGISYSRGRTYFHSTNGGDSSAGQAWEYQPLGNNRGRLTLVYESPDSSVLDSPDNITVSPRGGILMCEDGGGDQYLRGLTHAGGIYDFGLNLFTSSEWAGACFSKDGQTLFVNTQGKTTGTIAAGAGAGMTYAIWGPWENGTL